MTAADLRVACEHGRYDPHTFSTAGAKCCDDVGYWRVYHDCPGGRPATLEDLGGEVIEWCLQHRQPLIANGTCNLIELDGEPCRIVERILIPLPQMVAEQ